jgi:hypothetical protein
MGQTARTRALAFDERAVAPRILALYEALLS